MIEAIVRAERIKLVLIDVLTEYLDGAVAEQTGCAIIASGT